MKIGKNFHVKFLLTNLSFGAYNKIMSKRFDNILLFMEE